MNEELVRNDLVLAEDDNDDVLIFEMALKQLKIAYQLRTVDNGEKLFVILKERKPHILFLDIHMPCKDGVSCIIEIRKNRDYDDMPVIVYTSDISKKTIEDTYRSGANLYLTKPDTLSELTRKLKNILTKDWRSYLDFPPHDQYVH